MQQLAKGGGGKKDGETCVLIPPGIWRQPSFQLFFCSKTNIADFFYARLFKRKVHLKILVSHIIYFVLFLPFLGGNQDLVFVICASEIPPPPPSAVQASASPLDTLLFPQKKPWKYGHFIFFIPPPLGLCAYDVGYIHICRKTLPALVLCRAKKRGRQERKWEISFLFFLSCVCGKKHVFPCKN